MSPDAERLAMVRLQLQQLRGYLANWPNPLNKTPARVRRMRLNARRLDGVVCFLANHLISPGCSNTLSEDRTPSTMAVQRIGTARRCFTHPQN